MTPELTDFVFGWRGFLVGHRRNWHAHHRWGVTGFRGRSLLVRPAVQSGQLRAAAGLLSDVFARGGLAWAFGAGSGRPSWGRARPTWRPGYLSNYFFARLRRTHFVRRLLRVFQPSRPRRRFTELAVRWRRLRRAGTLPGPQRIRMGAWASGLERLATGAAGEVAPSRSPRAARRRARWFREWWVRAAALDARARSPRRGHRRGVPARAVYSPAARAVRSAQHRRDGRRVRLIAGRQTTGVSQRSAVVATPPGRRTPPTRRGSRHAGWPLRYPAVVVAGGLTLLGATLLNEVTSTGLPFVRFGGVDARPRTALFEVYWNGDTAASAGIVGWLDDLYGRSVRTGLFRICWRRLARLAER